MYTYIDIYMDQETGLLATIRDTPPLKAGTREARSASRLSAKRKKKRMADSRTCFSVYERYSFMLLYIKCIQRIQTRKQVVK